MKGKEFLELSVFLFAFRQQTTQSKASKTARAHLHIPIMPHLLANRKVTRSHGSTVK